MVPRTTHNFRRPTRSVTGLCNCICSDVKRQNSTVWFLIRMPCFNIAHKSMKTCSQPDLLAPNHFGRSSGQPGCLFFVHIHLQCPLRVFNNETTKSVYKLKRQSDVRCGLAGWNVVVTTVVS